MWSPERLTEVLQIRPFQGFVLHMADGQEIEVKHPKLAAVFAKERVIIVSYMGNVHVLDILMVTDIEFRAEQDSEAFFTRIRRKGS
jgi:hypothetical protein